MRKSRIPQALKIRQRLWLLPFFLTAPAAQAATVAIDVGHGNTAPNQGVISARGVPEFAFNLALARTLDAALRADGHATRLIADDGLTEDLVSRPRRAREAKADLFVSVHHDAAKERLQEEWQFEGRIQKALDDRFRGFSVFVSRENPEWRRALKCASAIGARLIAAGFTPSLYHADPVLGEGREFADRKNGVHYYDHLAVLRHAAMPALLLEAGVILNRDEELMMARDDTRARIAGAVRDAIPACIVR